MCWLLLMIPLCMECVFWQSYPKYPDNNMASEIYRLWADAKIGGVPQCYLDGVCLIYISVDIKKLNEQDCQWRQSRGDVIVLLMGGS